MEKLTLVTAHAGCEGMPRDSVESVRTGIALGADFVEIDVRLTSKGRLVMSHDKKNDEDYAALDDVATALAVIAGTAAGVNCDIKEEQAIFPILKLADHFAIPRERLVLTGLVTPRFLDSAPEILRRATVLMNVGNFACQDAGVLAEKCLALGVRGVNMPFGYATKEALDVFESSGLWSSVWTVDDAGVRKRLFDAKVYNITTRHVFAALRERAGLA